MKKIFEVNNQSKILMFIKWTKENESGQKFDLQYYVKYGIIINDVGITLHNN